MNSAPTRKLIAAGMIGNVLEWYDFAIYGYFAAAIGRHFFPREDPVAQLLAAFAVFAVGLSGAADRRRAHRPYRRPLRTPRRPHRLGRGHGDPDFPDRPSCPATRRSACWPRSRSSCCAWCRGFRSAANTPARWCFWSSTPPAGRRGLMGAFICCGTTIGILLGSGVGATIAAMMSTATLDAWGWRIPFLLGLGVGVAGFILRRHVIEAAPVARGERSPIVETLRDHWRLVGRLAALSVFNAVSFYVMFVYVASWLQTADGISPAHALEINTISMMILLPALLGLGLAGGPLRPQTGLDAVDRARGHRRPAAVLGHASPRTGPDPAGTDGHRPVDRALRRRPGDGDGRIRARRGSAAPRWRWATTYAWERSAGSRRWWRPGWCSAPRRARSRLSDHGRGGGLVPRRLEPQGNVPDAARLRRHHFPARAASERKAGRAPAKAPFDARSARARNSSANSLSETATQSSSALSAR